jgi:predicted aconitase with swiveling domain
MDGCVVLVSGSAQGEVLVLDEPLSFWGGLDTATGEIIDRHHPQHGAFVTGRIVVMPFARGSSSTANSLAESIHRGTGPAAIVLAEPDAIVVLGAVVPGELYDEWCPVLVASAAVRAGLASGRRVAVNASGIRLLDAGECGSGL